MTSTKVAQINLHHAKAASAAIVRASTKFNIGIVLVQEPWVFRGKIRGLTGKDTQVIWDIRCEKPRACMLLKTSSKYLCLSEFLSRDLVAARVPMNIKGTIRDVVVASSYFPGDDSNAPPDLVDKLVSYCNRNDLPLLLGCDANAHNEVWGSTDTNQRGEYLLEFI